MVEILNYSLCLLLFMYEFFFFPLLFYVPVPELSTYRMFWVWVDFSAWTHNVIKYNNFDPRGFASQNPGTPFWGAKCTRSSSSSFICFSSFRLLRQQVRRRGLRRVRGLGAHSHRERRHQDDYSVSVFHQHGDVRRLWHKVSEHAGNLVVQGSA